MKKYKLLIDSPEISRGTVVTQEKDGSYSYQYTYTFNGAITEGRRFFQLHEVEERPTVWQEIIEEPKKQIVERWRAKNGENFYYVSDGGEVFRGIDNRGETSTYCYFTLNYFQTREEAEAYKARQEAIGRVTHAIIEANEGWEPDWINDFSVYNIIVEHGVAMNVTHCTLQSPTLFPYCKTKDIALSIISSHKEDLDLIFNLK